MKKIPVTRADIVIKDNDLDCLDVMLGYATDTLTNCTVLEVGPSWVTFAHLGKTKTLPREQIIEIQWRS